MGSEPSFEHHDAPDQVGLQLHVDLHSPSQVLAAIRHELATLPDTQLILNRLTGAGLIVDLESTPSAVLGCASVLMDAGLIDQAEALYKAASCSFAYHPGGTIGLAQAATRRRNWVHALQLWDNALAAFHHVMNPFWMSARAMVLVQLGREQEAVDILSGLSRDFPDLAAGAVGMAQLALRKKQWREAIEQCNQLLDRFRNHPAAPHWRLMRAAALRELGEREEAERIAKASVSEHPLLLPALLLLLRILATPDRAGEAWAALEASPFAHVETSALVEQRLDLLVRWKRREAARSLFRSSLARASRPSIWMAHADLLESLFAFVPALFDSPERPSVLRSLLANSAQLRSNPGEAEQAPFALDKASFAVLDARLHLALREHAAVTAAIEPLTAIPNIGERGESLRCLSRVLSDARYPDFSKPKVFGIGLSRTGTTTLAAALQTLGLETLHWSNPLTGEVISEDDFFLFDAFTDIPVIAHFESLYGRFPNSMFILTLRPFQAWAASMSVLWRRAIGMSEFAEIKAELTGQNATLYGAEFSEINRRQYFDFNSFREAYDAHHSRVREFFKAKPRKRFLQFDLFAGDSWPELCAFLNREIPAEPFPWENRGSPPAVATQAGIANHSAGDVQ